jgi:hypothetical protein
MPPPLRTILFGSAFLMSLILLIVVGYSLSIGNDNSVLVQGSDERPNFQEGVILN